MAGMAMPHTTWPPKPTMFATFINRVIQTMILITHSPYNINNPFI